MGSTKMTASKFPGRFDEILMGMASQHAGIEDLLHSVFDFLHRKTDFYMVSNDPAEKGMGFLPQSAEQVLMRTFRKFPMKLIDETKSAEEESRRKPKGTLTVEANAAPQSKSDAVSSLAPVDAAPPPAQAPAKATNPFEAIRYTDEGKQIPIGNGGICNNYYWVQTLDEVTIYVNVPRGTNSKDIECSIASQHLKIGMRGLPPIIDGALPYKVRCEDSLWSLESNETVIISLEKIQKTWWKSVIEGDPEIDATKVDSTMKVSDYDEVTQAAIRKIMFDQKQNAQGLPTSDEMTQAALLEKAKLMPGSPFLP